MALLGSGEHHASPFACQNQESLWVCSEGILRWAVFGDYLARNELPSPHEAVLACSKYGLRDHKKTEQKYAHGSPPLPKPAYLTVRARYPADWITDNPSVGTP